MSDFKISSLPGMLLKKLRSIFLYGGLSKEEFELIKQDARDENYKTWKVFSPFGCFYFLVMFILSSPLESITLNMIAYFVMMVLFGTGAVLFRTALDRESKFMMPFIYFLDFAMLLFSIYIGVIAAPEYVSVTFMVLFVMLPLVTIGRFIWIELVLTVSGVIFLISCLMMKTGDILQLEITNLCCFWAIAMAISARANATRIRGLYSNRMLEESSEKDGLTHVKNSASYARMKVSLDAQIKKNSAPPFALVICDVNNLKEVNDSFGHEKGDEYLIRNCHAICRIYKHSPVYRIGGDEFLVYLTGSDYEERFILQNRCAEACSGSAFSITRADRTSFAMGMADYREGDRFLDVFKRADSAMYANKKFMHSRVSEKAPEMQNIEKRPGRKAILTTGGTTEDRNHIASVFGDRFDVIIPDDGGDLHDIIRENLNRLSLIIADVELNTDIACRFLSELKDDPLCGQIPVLAIGPANDTETEDRCLRLGAKDYLDKPYSMNVLIMRADILIEFRESSQAINAIEYDSLTGLYTRQAFMHFAEYELRNNPDRRYDLIISDIDNFKAINDAYGRDTGDNILKSIAELISTMSVEGAVHARYGSDQFVSLVPYIEANDKSELGKIFDDFAEKNPQFTFSIVNRFGVYCDVDHSLDISTICDRAMMALRTIKHQYGEKVAYYDSKVQKQHERLAKIEQSMSEAYSSGQFRLYYQPKHDTVTGRLVGAEALVRWEHPAFGFMSPGEFIPVFESNGFISYLDDYVWKKNCVNIRKWLDEGLDVVPVSVNASRIDFERREFMKAVLTPVKEQNIDPSLLHIEITESVLNTEFEELVDKVMECRRLGFMIELDDFGTGYSSLGNLNRVTIDILKLDKSLIDNCLTEKE